jgi:hypothetical protein
MSTDLFRAMSNEQASADLSSYFNSLGHVPEEQAKEYKEEVEKAQKQNELQDALVDASAAPFVEHGVGGGVQQIVNKIKGRLSQKAQQLAKRALVDKGVDEDLADRLVQGKITPSELYEQVKRRGGQGLQNLRERFGGEVEDAAGRAQGALNDARATVQDAADQAAATARDAANQAQRAGNAAADQLANQADDVRAAAQGRVADLTNNPLNGPDVPAQGAAAPAAPGDGAPGAVQTRTDRVAFNQAQDAYDQRFNELRQAQEDARQKLQTATDLRDAEQGKYLDAQMERGFDLDDAERQALKQPFEDAQLAHRQALDEFTQAHQEYNDFANQPGPQEADFQVPQDINPAQSAANRAAAARQNQDINPGQDVDGHAGQGQGSNVRRTTGDDDNIADPDDPTAPAGETAGADATADETIAGVSDAVDVAAAGEGFLDPLADFAALAVGLGLMGGIQAAKKQMPKVPTPNVPINPAGGIGL